MRNTSVQLWLLILYLNKSWSQNISDYICIFHCRGPVWCDSAAPARGSIAITCKSPLQYIHDGIMKNVGGWNWWDLSEFSLKLTQWLFRFPLQITKKGEKRKGSVTCVCKEDSWNLLGRVPFHGKGGEEPYYVFQSLPSP